MLKLVKELRPSDMMLVNRAIKGLDSSHPVSMFRNGQSYSLMEMMYSHTQIYRSDTSLLRIIPARTSPPLISTFPSSHHQMSCLSSSAYKCFCGRSRCKTWHRLSKLLHVTKIRIPIASSPERLSNNALCRSRRRCPSPGWELGISTLITPYHQGLFLIRTPPSTPTVSLTSNVSLGRWARRLKYSTCPSPLD